MQPKHFTLVLMAAALLACKPPAQATTQTSSPDPQKSSNASAEKGDLTFSQSDIADEDKRWRKDKAEGVTEVFFTCIRQGNYATIEVTNCASDEKTRQDSRLNKVYQELLSGLSGDKRTALVRAQRSWLVWKDKEERFEVAVYGSEQMDNAELEVREMNRLAQRADELEHYKINADPRSHRDHQ